MDDFRENIVVYPGILHRTFDTSFFQVPGRMNIFDQHPFTTILDYGHNPAAIKNTIPKFLFDGNLI